MEMAAALVEIIRATGPVGAVIAAVLVGLGLIVIIYGRTKGIVVESGTAANTVTFQRQLLEAVRLLTESEAATRRDNAELREEIGRLMTTVDLLRNQQRRVLEQLRAVVDGKLAVADIRLPAEAAS